MNKQLSAVYFCKTSRNKWAKGYSIREVKKAVEATTAGTEYYVSAAILDNPTPEELKNMHDCITGDQIDGSPHYYRDDRSEADSEQIQRLHIGWLSVETNVK